MPAVMESCCHAPWCVWPGVSVPLPSSRLGLTEVRLKSSGLQSINLNIRFARKQEKNKRGVSVRKKFQLVEVRL